MRNERGYVGINFRSAVIALLLFSCFQENYNQRTRTGTESGIFGADEEGMREDKRKNDRGNMSPVKPYSF